MTSATKACLFYLRRYLKENPGEQSKLCAMHLTKTKRELNRGSLHRHLSLKIEPVMSTALVYLSFLHKRGQLIPAPKGQGIFTYKNPEFLKNET